MPGPPEAPERTSDRKGGWLIRSFSVADTPEKRQLLKEAQLLAKHDGDSFSELTVKALVEYVKRHSPGNPQLVLVHWTENVPLPESTRSTHVHRWTKIASHEEYPYQDAWACADKDCWELWVQQWPER